MTIRFFFIVIISSLFIACNNIAETITPPIPTSTQNSTEQVLNLEDRTSWQKPQLIIDKLGDLENKVVADIGAGTGYFSFRMIHKAKKVIAVDIDTTMIHLIDAFKSTMSNELQAKLETRLALPDDPLLSKNEADMVLFVNVVTYINDKRSYFNRLINNLNKGSKIVIVDYKSKRLPIEDAPDQSIRVSMTEIEELLYSLGCQNVVVDDRTLDFQYMITAII